MTTPPDIAELRRLLTAAESDGPLDLVLGATAQILDALPRMLDRVEELEWLAQDRDENLTREEELNEKLQARIDKALGLLDIAVGMDDWPMAAIKQLTVAIRAALEPGEGGSY